MEKQKKIWLNIILVIVILLTMITIVSSMNDMQAVLSLMGTLDIPFFLLALLLGLISFILMSLSSQFVLTALNKDLPFSIGFLIQATEPFFNGITPFSSGAQPFQLYYYHKHKVDPNHATSVIVVNFILFQITSVLLSTIGLIAFWQDIYNAMGGNMTFIVIGYTINTAILVGLFLVAYIKKAYRLFEKLFSFFQKFKLTNKLATNLHEKTFGFVTKFQQGVQFLFTKKRVFILGALFKLLSLITLYSTTIFIVVSLGFEINLNDNIYIVVAGILATTTMMFVPLPGASGGTEAAFVGLMSVLFITGINASSAVTIMLLWRVATYYFGMLYGLIAYLILKQKEVKL